MVASRLSWKITIALLAVCIHYFLSSASGSFMKYQELRSNLPTDFEPVVQRRVRRGTGCCNVTVCTASTYRTINGVCNNALHPCWGSASIPSARFKPPQYGNGISTPRGTGSNPPLPRPRDVSVALVSTTVTPFISDGITLMVMQVGQFCDHDLTFTPETANATSCCNSTNTECFPIIVSNDTFYRQFNITCRSFTRSAATLCPPGSTREQINEVTAYIDGSQIYGSTQAELNAVRVSSSSFLLKFGPGRENLNCLADNPTVPCRSFLPERTNNMTNRTEFFAGDRRVEETPGLTSMHALFLRFHNDIAGEISFQNPGCSNETVFQETRKIVGAVLQHIIYNEFLPIVLGPNIMQRFNLSVRTYIGYDTSLDASIASAFATAAFRFGHSLIPNTFILPAATVNLAEVFNNHDVTTFANTLPSDFMRGISDDPSEAMDHILVDGVVNKLYASFPFTFGDDLLARNIQRSRDHGLASYTTWIKTNTCATRNITTFSDLTGVMPNEVINTLNRTYGNRVHDVDLFPAGIAEFNLAGALLGPTFACINAEQFKRLKYGDSMWYERPTIFTTAQLNSIYNTTLATLICAYTNEQILQDLVMLPVSSSNPLINCSIITSVGVVRDVSTNWRNLICPTVPG